MIAAAPAPAYVGVAQDDRRDPWRLDATRASVRLAAGARKRTVVFSVSNYGMDPHNLAVRRVGSTALIRTSGLIPAASGGRPGTGTLRVALPPGRYMLVCTIGRGTAESHVRRGMHDRFAVVRRAAR